MCQVGRGHTMWDGKPGLHNTIATWLQYCPSKQWMALQLASNHPFSVFPHLHSLEICKTTCEQPTGLSRSTRGRGNIAAPPRKGLVAARCATHNNRTPLLLFTSVLLPSSSICISLSLFLSLARLLALPPCSLGRSVYPPTDVPIHPLPEDQPIYPTHMGFYACRKLVAMRMHPPADRAEQAVAVRGEPCQDATEPPCATAKGERMWAMHTHSTHEPLLRSALRHKGR